MNKANLQEIFPYFITSSERLCNWISSKTKVVTHKRWYFVVLIFKPFHSTQVMIIVFRGPSFGVETKNYNSFYILFTKWPISIANPFFIASTKRCNNSLKSSIVYDSYLSFSLPFYFLFFISLLWISHYGKKLIIIQ